MEGKVLNLCLHSGVSHTNPLVVEAWFSFMRTLKKIPTQPAVWTMTEFDKKASVKGTFFGKHLSSCFVRALRFPAVLAWQKANSSQELPGKDYAQTREPKKCDARLFWEDGCTG